MELDRCEKRGKTQTRISRHTMCQHVAEGDCQRCTIKRKVHARHTYIFNLYSAEIATNRKLDGLKDKHAEMVAAQEATRLQHIEQAKRIREVAKEHDDILKELHAIQMKRIKIAEEEANNNWGGPAPRRTVSDTTTIHSEGKAKERPCVPTKEKAKSEDPELECDEIGPLAEDYKGDDQAVIQDIQDFIEEGGFSREKK